MDDFAPLDHLHVGGKAATLRLLDWLPWGSKAGLDMGCGLGGCVRLIQQRHQSKASAHDHSATGSTHYQPLYMVGTDINQEYIQAAHLISQCLMQQANTVQSSPCSFVVADSLATPFASHQFDFIISQHALMTIKDKGALLAEVKRLLTPGGLFIMHEIFLATDLVSSAINYPTPWADKDEDSCLQTWPDFMTSAKHTGLALVEARDDTQLCLAEMQIQRQAHQARKQGELTQPVTDTNTVDLFPGFSPSLVLGKEAGLKSRLVAEQLAAGKLVIQASAWRT